MLNMNADALGIIFPNSYDAMVPELARERLMASIPFAGRYRIIDFLLSSMVNGGIDNISLIVKENYHSLMDHLGSGREWDLTRKNGGLNLVPQGVQRTCGSDIQHDSLPEKAEGKVCGDVRHQSGRKF